MITIAETESFLKKASRLLPKEEKGNLILYLSEHPSGGDLIQGTGGIRKLRWAKGSKGKSGGFRVIYYFHNEKINISITEKHILSKAVKELVEYWRGK